MNSKEKIVLQKVQDYFLTVKTIGELYSTILENGDFEGSLTTKYSLDGGSRSNVFRSKIEGNVIKKIDLETKINELSNEIYILKEACKCIGKDEKRVIDHIMQGEKLSAIARKFGYKRKKVETIRNAAIRKMTKYIDQ